MLCCVVLFRRYITVPAMRYKQQFPQFNVSRLMSLILFLISLNNDSLHSVVSHLVTLSTPVSHSNNDSSLFLAHSAFFAEFFVTPQQLTVILHFYIIFLLFLMLPPQLCDHSVLSGIFQHSTSCVIISTADYALVLCSSIITQ